MVLDGGLFRHRDRYRLFPQLVLQRSVHNVYRDRLRALYERGQLLVERQVGGFDDRG